MIKGYEQASKYTLDILLKRFMNNVEKGGGNDAKIETQNCNLDDKKLI